MGNNKKNKKNKKKKEKKETVYRTREQRCEEIKTIIKQLSGFELTIVYEPIKKLYVLFSCKRTTGFFFSL